MPLGPQVTLLCLPQCYVGVYAVSPAFLLPVTSLPLDGHSYCSTVSTLTVVIH